MKMLNKVADYCLENAPSPNGDIVESEAFSRVQSRVVQAVIFVPLLVNILIFKLWPGGPEFLWSTLEAMDLLPASAILNPHLTLVFMVSVAQILLALPISFFVLRAAYMKHVVRTGSMMPLSYRALAYFGGALISNAISISILLTLVIWPEMYGPDRLEEAARYARAPSIVAELAPLFACILVGSTIVGPAFQLWVALYKLRHRDAPHEAA